MHLIKHQPNILIITLDSCRSDVFFSTELKNLNKTVTYKQGYTHGTYTLPSHQSIYQGIFPSTTTNDWYFNRFSKQLIRLQPKTRKKANCYIELNSENGDIINGFNLMGYFSFCIGAVGWFKTSQLTKDFSKSVYTGINFSAQIDSLKNIITNETKPFFGVLNIGETHEPYNFGGFIEEITESRSRMRGFEDFGIINNLFRKQKSALQYIDNIFLEIINLLENRQEGTILVVCSDHGDCFGEDGLYGHGFFHEKVMEVPIGFGEINMLENSIWKK